MRELVATLIEVAGVAALVYGFWLIAPPAAWVVGGIVVIVVAHEAT